MECKFKVSMFLIILFFCLQCNQFKTKSENKILKDEGISLLEKEFLSFFDKYCMQDADLGFNVYEYYRQENFLKMNENIFLIDTIDNEVIYFFSPEMLNSSDVKQTGILFLKNIENNTIKIVAKSTRNVCNNINIEKLKELLDKDMNINSFKLISILTLYGYNRTYPSLYGMRLKNFNIIKDSIDFANFKELIKVDLEEVLSNMDSPLFEDFSKLEIPIIEKYDSCINYFYDYNLRVLKSNEETINSKRASYYNYISKIEHEAFLDEIFYFYSLPKFDLYKLNVNDLSIEEVSHIYSNKGE